MKKLKQFLILLVCASVLTTQTMSQNELYLIRRFYEITPGCGIRPLYVGHNSYDVLSDGWKRGDAYQTAVPEPNGYHFLPTLSDSLTGVFEDGDIYIDLYYTKEKFCVNKTKSLTQKRCCAEKPSEALPALLTHASA